MTNKSLFLILSVSSRINPFSGENQLGRTEKNGRIVLLVITILSPWEMDA